MRENNIGFASNDVGSDTYQIYRAIVVDDPDINPDDKSFRIYVKEAKSTPDRATGGVKEAYPPSPLPVSEFGEGMVSHPPKDTECIVMESKFEQKVQILSYAQTPNVVNATPFGIWYPEILSRGSVFFKVGMLTAASLILTPEGLGSLYCGPLANIEIDGKAKAVKTTSVSSVQTFTGGKIINDYFTTDPYSGLPHLTPHTEVYVKSQESPGNADGITELGETTLLTGVGSYTDKAIVRAGAITNQKKNTELFGQHPYQIETRQAVNGETKDTVTVMRFGDQAGQNSGSYKYSNDAFYPRGTLFEMSSKKIKTTSADTYLFRQGEYEDDVIEKSSTGVGPVIDGVKGEIFRHQIYSDITPSVKGLLLDNMGEGKGYEFKIPNASAKQQYVESFGTLTSDSAPTGMRNTVWRKHIHGYSAAPTNVGGGYVRTQLLGGDLLYSEEIAKKSFGSTTYGVKHTISETEWKSETASKTETLNRTIIVDGEYRVSSDEAYVSSESETLQVTATAEFIDTVRIQLSNLASAIETFNSALDSFVGVFTVDWVPVPMDGGASLKATVVVPAAQLQGATAVLNEQIGVVTGAIDGLNYNGEE